MFKAWEVVCIHTKQTKIDKGHGNEVRTYLGGLPEKGLMRIAGVGEPWSLVTTTVVTFDPIHGNRSEGQVILDLDVDHGRTWPCPMCGNPCRPYKYDDRRYRTIPMLNHQTWLVVKVPVLRCDACGAYPQVTVPWARPRVGYTIELEREIFRNLDDRSILSTAEYLDIGDWVVSDVVMYRVEEALKGLDLSKVTMVFIDETSFKKGHRYVTVVCDQDRRIVFMCEGKDAGTVDAFRIWLEGHGGKAENIRVVSCDMGLAYPAGVRRNFPNAKIVFDRFHVVKLVTEAFDRYYRRMAEEDSGLAEARFVTYRHLDDFTDRQRCMFDWITGSCKELADAYRMKEVIFHMYDFGGKDAAGHYFDVWYDYVMANGPPELKTAAGSLKDRKDQILMWYDHEVNNGFIEGMNSLIQTTKRVGRGYGNVRNFIYMCYLKNGHLDIRFRGMAFRSASRRRVGQSEPKERSDARLRPSLTEWAEAAGRSLLESLYHPFSIVNLN